MFKRKKKEVNTLKFEMVIPQISQDYEGLKTNKDKFRKSSIASPIFGSNVKDEILVRDVSKESKFDVNKGYDSYRTKEEKRINDEDLIKKYGTKYPEFQTINSALKKEIYGLETNHVKEEEKIEVIPDTNFSFIVDKVQPKVEEETIEEEFDFGVFRPTLVPNTFKEEEIKKEEPQSEEPYFNFTFDTPVEKEIKEVKNDYFNEVKNEVIEEVTKTNYHNEEVKSMDIPLIVDPYRDYQLPPLSIFKKTSSVEQELPLWVSEKKEIIDQSLQDFGIPGSVVNFTKGPTFTRYEILLQSGTNVKKVSSLNLNLQMNLGVKTFRILAPIPGKKTVGIEVPNEETEMVRYGDIINEDFINDKKNLRIALGKDIDGQSSYTSIDKMPHGLIAGATSSGKSVCINTLLISLLVKNRPDEVKLLLVDPKTVELISYNELPHLVTPVINDAQMASEALKWACEEMDKRYKMLSENRCRNIDDYNKKVKLDKTLLKMPYIVIVIDELADLMMVSSSDVEDSIKRITQKARAAGINLIVATQRPTVDVIKGTIKANIPTRIAFRVVSQVDSITILDESGAEDLLGKGDMLLKEGDAPTRLQGAYISDDEIDAVTDFIRAQAKPDYLFTHDDLKQKNVQGNTGNTQSNQESPEMLYQCALFFVENNNVSINALTQNFQIGFNRAQRIVAAFEEMEIVSVKKPTGKRDILVTKGQIDVMFDRGEDLD